MQNCNHQTQHNPIYCILPPYMLEQIAQNGTGQQQTVAQQTQFSSTTFRQQRQAIARGEIPGGIAMAAAPRVVGGQKQRFIYTANNTTTLPGSLVRQEGEPPTSDVAVNEA